MGIKLAEIDKLCASNSYLDLLKAERIAHDVYYNEGLKAYWRNIEEGIRVKNATLGELKAKENEIKNKSYAGWGWLSGVLTFF